MASPLSVSSTVYGSIGDTPGAVKTHHGRLPSEAAYHSGIVVLGEFEFVFDGLAGDEQMQPTDDQNR